MSLLYAIVVPVAVLGLANLFLVVGVIRRLREHTEMLTKQVKTSGPKVMLGVGERAEPFAAATTEGSPFTEDSLARGTATLIGLFAHGCSSCEERRPDFVRYARDFPGGRNRVFAVLVGESEQVAAERALLEPIAQTIIEEHPGGPVTSALKVKGYPAFAVLNPDGTVHTSGTLVEDLSLNPDLFVSA